MNKKVVHSCGALMGPAKHLETKIFREFVTMNQRSPGNQKKADFENSLNFYSAQKNLSRFLNVESPSRKKHLSFSLWGNSVKAVVDLFADLPDVVEDQQAVGATKIWKNRFRSISRLGSPISYSVRNISALKNYVKLFRYIIACWWAWALRKFFLNLIYWPLNLWH